VRGWDGWHSPCCGIMQHAPPNRLVVHEVIEGDGDMGTRELILEKLLPRLQKAEYRGKIHEWRDIGDPSMRTPDQSSTAMSAAKVIRELLHSRFEPGPTRWPQRIMPLRAALGRNGSDGQPQILISSTAHNLHKALNGGWHWKTDNAGNIIGNIPDKDEFSHLGDMLCYVAARLFPVVTREGDDARDRRRVAGRGADLAMSYAPAAH